VWNLSIEVNMQTIADHILDIVENSVRATATLIEIIILEDKKKDLYAVEIRDNGCGMSKETAGKALEPFFTSRTTRKVGLGLPLLKQNAEQCGGTMDLISEPGKGTVVNATFGLGHIDRPPLGDIALVLLLSMAGHDQISFLYSHTTGCGVYTLSSEELKETLGDVPLNSGERIPSRLSREGVSEQDTKKILDGIGFLAGSAARSFNNAEVRGAIKDLINNNLEKIHATK
jgi:hypothetical protein